MNHDFANRSYLYNLHEKTHINLEIWKDNIKVGPEEVRYEDELLSRSFRNFSSYGSFFYHTKRK